jgi:hypothetical protein
VPVTAATQVAACVALIADGLATTVIPVTVMGTVDEPILMEVEPDLVPSCVEVATQVPVPVAEGVKTPVCVMLPPLADQVTPVL